MSLAVAEKSRNVTPEKKNKNAKFIAVRYKWRRRNIKKQKEKKSSQPLRGGKEKRK